MRAAVGILGGSFDPVHRGHLALAAGARARLGLERVLLVPAGQQPLKRQGPVASPADRLRMLQLAVAEAGAQDWLQICTLELERPGPSYTVDTLQALRARLGGETELVFVAGADVLRDLQGWRRLDRVLELARFVVCSRPGFAAELPPALRGRIEHLELATPQVSSSAVRAAIAAGELERARAMVPAAVWRYIQERGLYRAARGPDAAPQAAGR
ncbi:MAG: putative nicotinate-nucleotide adenylyltransferase [Planctomycetota bacterium]|nr:MAG: putative nicotinate-nucleotide adenylyltransferase [Planctomycetota bacterium]